MWQSSTEKRAASRAEAERKFADMSQWIPLDPRLIDCLRQAFPETSRPPLLSESDRALWMAAGARDVIDTLAEIVRAQQDSADPFVGG